MGQDVRPEARNPCRWGLLWLRLWRGRARDRAICLLAQPRSRYSPPGKLQSRCPRGSSRRWNRRNWTRWSWWRRSPRAALTKGPACGALRRPTFSLADANAARLCTGFFLLLRATYQLWLALAGRPRVEITSNKLTSHRHAPRSSRGWAVRVYARSPSLPNRVNGTAATSTLS